MPRAFFRGNTMKTLFLATMESRSFSFQALGETRQQALDALVKGLNAHTRQFNLDPDWYSVEDDLGCTALELRHAYRDYLKLEG